MEPSSKPIQLHANNLDPMKLKVLGSLMTTGPQVSVFLLANWLITDRDFYDCSHNRQKRFQRSRLIHLFFPCNSMFYENMEAETRAILRINQRLLNCIKYLLSKNGKLVEKQKTTAVVGLILDKLLQGVMCHIRL